MEFTPILYMHAVKAVIAMDQHAFESQILDQPSAFIETELLTLNANLNAATYRFIVLIREFDRRGAWGDWGMYSMAQWLGWRHGDRA